MEGRTGTIDSTESGTITADKPASNGSTTERFDSGTDDGERKPRWGIRNSGIGGIFGNNDGTDGNSSSSERSTAYGTEEEAESLGQSRVTVEQPKEKPKRTYTRRQPKQILTAKDIENYLKMGFSWIALAKQAPWWGIDEDDNIEIWTPQAAVLANRYLAENAQKVKDGTDIASVGFGMLMLVYSRIRMDAQYRREMVRAKREELQRQEGVPEDQPKDVNEELQRQNGKISGLFGNPTGL